MLCLQVRYFPSFPKHLVLCSPIIRVVALLKKKKKAKLSHPTAIATEKAVEKDAEKEKAKAPTTEPAATATPIAASVGA